MTQIKVSTKRRTELVPITDRVQDAVLESKIEHGVCYVYVPHTTSGGDHQRECGPDGGPRYSARG